MLKGLKKAFGPSLAKSAPMKSVSEELIKDKIKQLKRWVEHYGALYSMKNRVSQEALNSSGSLPVLNKLNRMPTMVKLLKATDSLSQAKLLVLMASHLKWSKLAKATPSMHFSTPCSSPAG